MHSTNTKVTKVSSIIHVINLDRKTMNIFCSVGEGFLVNLYVSVSSCVARIASGRVWVSLYRSNCVWTCLGLAVSLVLRQEVSGSRCITRIASGLGTAFTLIILTNFPVSFLKRMVLSFKCYIPCLWCYSS